MALHKSYERAERHTAFAGPHPAQVVSVLEPSHSRLAVSIVHILPELHSRLGQFVFLSGLAEMLADHHCVRIGLENRTRIILQDGDARSVVIAHIALIVKVVIDRVWVRRGDVIPRVVLCSAALRAVPVESRHRVNSGGVVIDHV